MLSTTAQSSNWDNFVDSQHFHPNEKFINMSNRPVSSMPTNESELVSECRRGLVDGKSKEPMDHVRMLCLSRGASGIYNLGRSFRRMTDHGNTLSAAGFIKGLRAVEMNCSDDEAAEIFAAFDPEGKGYIDMANFLLDLRVLNSTREAMVNRCFKKSDKDGDDVITVADLSRSYCVKHHPRYQNGVEDRETIIKRFLATFEEGSNPSAKITLEEFLNYYAGISATIKEDGYFDLLLREEYNI